MNSHWDGRGNGIADALGEDKEFFFGNIQPSLRQPQGRKARLMRNHDFEISPAQSCFGKQALDKTGKNFPRPF